MARAPRAAGAAPAGGWLEPFVTGSIYFYLTGAVVALGVLLALRFFHDPPNRTPPFGHEPRPIVRCSNWDGIYYRGIAERGYEYAPKAMSSIAFFPAFPLSGRALMWATGLDSAHALVLVANAFLLLSFILLKKYADVRYPGSPPALGGYVLLSLGLMPPGFFFRMAYSESMFLFLTILTLYAILRRWPLAVVALVVGLSTATRSVGVALIAPLALEAWRRSSGFPAFARRMSYLLPLSVWGLAGFMLYQYREFGEPLAVVKSQHVWHMRAAETPAAKALALLTLEPLWESLDPEGEAHWSRREPRESLLFNLHVADPLYYALAAGLLALGVGRRWLSAAEWTACGTLLLIPYMLNSYEYHMYSTGRFSIVVVSTYLVLGQLLVRCPGPLAAALAGVSGLLLGSYAALFSTWYEFF